MKKSTLLLSIVLCVFTRTSFAQEVNTDSSKNLEEVTVRSFEQNKNSKNCAIMIKVINMTNSERGNKTSLVTALNTVPGVRMEERSPGSYRLNIRGSSLRSPFGVRNVKVYWNDLPVTDPSGNTYFNQFAWNNFATLEIFKGPAGSMYGAGTGGLILMSPTSYWKPGVSLEYLTGSYGLQNIFTSARFGTKEDQNDLTFAHNQNDGYRVQTQMRRDNFSWSSKIISSTKNELTASFLFTDMYYQTPGALTAAEYAANPKAARPAGGGFPSAVNAHADILQQTVLAGFTNKYQISKSIRNTTSLFGAYARIKNSAIRNYERRSEPQYGARSFFTWSATKDKNTFQLITGTEVQLGFFNTQVSKNKNGHPDTLQTNDDIRNTAASYFVQGDINLGGQWIFNSGFSVNETRISINRLSVYPVKTQARTYRNEIAPRFSIRHNFNKTDLSVFGTVSRGFSPPTVAEVLPSTGVISTNLEAEYGWNYEMTVRNSFHRINLNVEITAFYFKLNNALVQRRDISGADYFVNAGNAKQQGIEGYLQWNTFFHGSGIFDYFMLRSSIALNHFRYGSFIKGTDNFSGKTIPSVPSQTLSSLANLYFKKGFYTSLSYYSASRIWLNDANTASAKAYHLLGARIGWEAPNAKKYKTGIYAGADNLLDEQYSLGNDINAAANRYYNAAPRRNYYIGVTFQWVKKQAK